MPPPTPGLGRILSGILGSFVVRWPLPLARARRLEPAPRKWERVFPTGLCHLAPGRGRSASLHPGPSPGPSAPGRVWSGLVARLRCPVRGEGSSRLLAKGAGGGLPSGGRTQGSGRKLRGESFWHLVYPKRLCRKVPSLWGPETPHSAIRPSQGPVWVRGPWPHRQPCSVRDEHPAGCQLLLL